PKAYPYRRDDTLNLPPETEPLPERCQFMFSDGRQCTMARSDIHPSLCHYHSEREDQLFGTPSSGGGSVVGAGFDLPELYSACRDLTTAAGVHRAVAQGFALLAQRRISRQEAATFGHLAQLLLRSISLMRAELTTDDNHHGGTGVILSEQRRISPESSRSTTSTPLLPQEKAARSSGAHPNTKPLAKPEPSFRATIWSEESLSASPTPEESSPQITRLSTYAPSRGNPRQRPPACPLTPRPVLRRRCQNPLPPKTHSESTHLQLLSATRVKSTHTKKLNLKSRTMNTYTRMGARLTSISGTGERRSDASDARATGMAIVN